MSFVDEVRASRPDSVDPHVMEDNSIRFHSNSVAYKIKQDIIEKAKKYPKDGSDLSIESFVLLWSNLDSNFNDLVEYSYNMTTRDGFFGLKEKYVAEYHLKALAEHVLADARNLLIADNIYLLGFGLTFGRGAVAAPTISFPVRIVEYQTPWRNSTNINGIEYQNLKIGWPNLVAIYKFSESIR